jgi:hypothetical protein
MGNNSAVPASNTGMRYWGYLGAKLLALGFALRFLWLGITKLLPQPVLYRGQFFGYDLGWTLAAGVFFLISCGAVYLCFVEQRYRCRVCLRRLRMPITTGSWGQILQRGRPKVEYICPYGHGTLKIDELQIDGLETADWQRHSDDIWTELGSMPGTRP